MTDIHKEVKYDNSCLLIDDAMTCVFSRNIAFVLIFFENFETLKLQLQSWLLQISCLSAPLEAVQVTGEYPDTPNDSGRRFWRMSISGESSGQYQSPQGM